MLTIIYNREGVAVSDFEAQEYVKQIIEKYNKIKTNLTIKVANEGVYRLFGLAALRDEIDCHDIEFYWGCCPCKVDKLIGFYFLNENCETPGFVAGIEKRILKCLSKYWKGNN